MLTHIELSKAQSSKTILSGGFLPALLGKLSVSSASAIGSAIQ